MGLPMLTQALSPTVDYYFPHPPPQKPDVGPEVDEEKEEMSESDRQIAQQAASRGQMSLPDVPLAQLGSLCSLLSRILMYLLQA